MNRSWQNSKKRLRAFGLIAALLAVFLLALYLLRGNSHRDLASLAGPVGRLQESSTTEPLQGQLLTRLGEGGRATAISVASEKSFYVLMPDAQKVARFDGSGNVLWSTDLRSACQCGFCVHMNAKPDGSVLVLDMRDDQVCEINSDGRPVRRFPLPGSDVSVTFGVSRGGVLVNSLLGDATLAAYDFDGRRLPFAEGPAWDTPEKRFTYPLPVEQGWAVVHRHAGIIRLLGPEGEPIAAFSKGAWDPFRSERTVAYFGCSPGTNQTIWCLAPSE